MMRENDIQSFALAALDIPEKAALNIDIEDCFELRPKAEIDGDGIATIQIHGGLVDACPPIYEKLGLVTRYQTITGEITEAINQGATGILLNTDSPGGTVTGCAEAAQFIADLPVPTFAFCQGLACSAAYKLISGTDVIIATQSALVGNIGTILSWTDCSQFWKDQGIEFKALTSEGASLKSTFHLEPDEEQLTFLQESINEAGKQFRDHVTAGRTAAGAELDPEIWKAGWYSGEKALNLGLIDDVGTAEDARVWLNSRI